jgi:hypothetical protein
MRQHRTVRIESSKARSRGTGCLRRTWGCRWRPGRASQRPRRGRLRTQERTSCWQRKACIRSELPRRLQGACEAETVAMGQSKVFTGPGDAGKRSRRARSEWRRPVQRIATVMRMQYARAKGRIAMLKSGRIAKQVVAAAHGNPEDQARQGDEYLSRIRRQPDVRLDAGPMKG